MLGVSLWCEVRPSNIKPDVVVRVLEMRMEPNGAFAIRLECVGLEGLWDHRLSPPRNRSQCQQMKRRGDTYETGTY